jgi:hypothetical protein
VRTGDLKRNRWNVGGMNVKIVERSFVNVIIANNGAFHVFQWREIGEVRCIFCRVLKDGLNFCEEEGFEGESLECRRDE